jgi:uncharacterized hydrophobic protein (TIGR00271 family)
MKQLRLFRKIQSKFAHALGINQDRKKQLSIELSEAATLKDFVYWLQIFFSAGIATLGLVLNSPAVIIGAMLISPLMGPILSAGLALATGDLILGIRAVLNITLSSLAAIAFAVFLVALLPFKEMTAEISARTAPNTLDLFVALFSGAIGSIATCREEKGIVTSIPGVAIAVALMPPLCVTGYGIGLALSFNFTQGIDTALGGGLLFLTNLFAITFMAMLAFLLLRIDTANVRKALEEWRLTDSENVFVDRIIQTIPALENARILRNVPFRVLMILIPLLVIIIPLSSSFSKLKNEITQQQSENQTKQIALGIWKERYEKSTEGAARSFVDSISISEINGKVGVTLRIFDNDAYSEAEKKEYVRLLASALNMAPVSIDFQLIEIPTSARARSTFEETPREVSIAEIQANFVQKGNSALANLPFPSNAKLINYDFITSRNGKLILRGWYLSANEMSIDAKDLIAQSVRQSLKVPSAETELVFVSSVSSPLSFNGNGSQLSNTDALEVAAKFMTALEKLRLNVSLKKINGNGQEILEKRKTAILDFLSTRWKISAERISFTEGEDESRFYLSSAES